MLSLTAERQLIARWQDSRDRSALQALLEHMKPAISALASRSDRRSGLEEDMVSQATLAVMKVIDRYTPEGDTRFFTYARRAILGAMGDERRMLGYPVAVPRPSRRTDSNSGEQGLERAALPIAIDTLDDPEGCELACLAPGCEDIMAQQQQRVLLRRVLCEAISSMSPLEHALLHRLLQEECERASLEEFCRDWRISPKYAKKIETRALLELRSALMSRGITPAMLNGTVE